VIYETGQLFVTTQFVVLKRSLDLRVDILRIHRSEVHLNIITHRDYLIRRTANEPNDRTERLPQCDALILPGPCLATVRRRIPRIPIGLLVGGFIIDDAN